MVVLYIVQSLSERAQREHTIGSKMMRKQSVRLGLLSQNCERRKEEREGRTNHVSREDSRGEVQRKTRSETLKNWRDQEGTMLFWKNIESQDAEKHLPPCSPPTPNGDGALQEFICQGINEYEFMIMNM